MAHTHRVALVIETFAEHGRSVVRGVAGYVERNRSWQLHTLPLGQNTTAILKDAVQADGLITRLYNDELAQIVEAARVPVVTVHYWGKRPVPSVGSNSRQVSALAVQHLHGQGFRHFGFFGAERAFALQRGRAFSTQLCKMGFTCHTCFAGPLQPQTFNWHQADTTVLQWLRDLPKPIGIMAANDSMAHHLLLCAAHAGVRVPDDVAVVGVDNDELLCRITSPPLSSIDIGGEHIGYQAAAMLDRLLAGKKLPRRAVLVDPVGLVVRQSSDVLAVQDKNVSAAVRFIRENIAQNVGVEAVLEYVPVGRRTLEQAFRKSLGRSIHDEIAESRIRLAKRLLVETDMAILEIAEACGFRYGTHLSASFAKAAGLCPADFRKKFRKPR